MKNWQLTIQVVAIYIIFAGFTHLYGLNNPNNHSAEAKVPSRPRSTPHAGPSYAKVRVQSKPAQRHRVEERPVNSTDLYWLSRVIQAESGDQSTLCKEAVGEVIWNRAHKTSHKATIEQVIFRHRGDIYQFSSVANGSIHNVPSGQSVQAAKNVLMDHVHIVPNAYVFYDSHASSHNWVRQQPIVAHIDDMTFAA